MRISFFEEFPTKANLSRLKLVDFPTRLYAAAKSIKEFNRIRKDCSKYMYVQEVCYWPVLREEEGYWFSAFSDAEGLKRVIKELEKNERQLTVLWDAELPYLKKSLVFSQATNVFKNKKLIMDFLQNASEHKIKVVTAEYSVKNKLLAKLFQFFATTFDQDNFKHAKILMAYSSAIKNDSIKSRIQFLKKQYKDFQLGIGMLAPGMGNEPVMTIEQLDKDLKAAKSSGIKEVVIYRLGGLDKRNIRTIKKYV
ncbi:hypothetical protein KY361_01910 [Candidatus Woesearchaeota archaeon]|nr:hypothetical protein [Candidatus Woesearchaeota archaeon]